MKNPGLLGFIFDFDFILLFYFSQDRYKDKVF